MPRRRMSLAVVAFLGALGCGEDGPSPLLAPPPAGQGVQIKLVSTLAPGSMAERCMFYRVPAGGLYVNREDVRYTTGCHHVMLYETPYADIPTVTVHGETVDTSGVFDCSGHGALGDWAIAGAVGGAQSTDGTPAVQGLPADTAIKLDGGSVLLVAASYMNAGDKTLAPEIDIDLYTVPAAQVTREAGMFFLYDPFIYLPSESNGSAREACPINRDVTLLNAQSHMHARGYQYVANLVDSNGAQLQEIFTTQSWQNVASEQMNPPLALTAGQRIQFQCNYRNNEARTIVQGGTMEDEMCVFLGLYYPKDSRTELCSMTGDWTGRYLGASWIGSGPADGSQTADCLEAATGPSAAPGDVDACVVNACPAISVETSNATRCLVSLGAGQCANECGSGDAAACNACVAQQCAPAVAALAGAGCA